MGHGLQIIIPATTIMLAFSSLMVKRLTVYLDIVAESSVLVYMMILTIEIFMSCTRETYGRESTSGQTSR